MFNRYMDKVETRSFILRFCNLLTKLLFHSVHHSYFHYNSVTPRKILVALSFTYLLLCFSRYFFVSLTFFSYFLCILPFFIFLYTLIGLAFSIQSRRVTYRKHRLVNFTLLLSRLCHFLSIYLIHVSLLLTLVLFRLLGFMRYFKLIFDDSNYS